MRAPPPPAPPVTKLALSKRGVSLESSQLGESQAALEICSREGDLRGSNGDSHLLRSPGPCSQAVMLLQRPLVDLSLTTAWGPQKQMTTRLTHLPARAL